eukprot:2240171-Pleurochrysis_carterae.AAC.2
MLTFKYYPFHPSTRNRHITQPLAQARACPPSSVTARSTLHHACVRANQDSHDQPHQHGRRAMNLTMHALTYCPTGRVCGSYSISTVRGDAQGREEVR